MNRENIFAASFRVMGAFTGYNTHTTKTSETCVLYADAFVSNGKQALTELYDPGTCPVG